MSAIAPEPRVPPDPASLARYRKRAAHYDTRTGRTWPLRERTIGLLRLRAGDTVIDVGCGTGLSFALLLAGVGSTGRVVGIEQSPDMMARARERVARSGWPNVLLVEDCCESADPGCRFDAILFNYTHDICRSPRAIARLFAHARPGARVAMAGMKFFPWWTGPLNLYAWLKNHAYNARAADMWAPWDIVQRYVPDLQVRPTQWGMGYIAHGTVPADERP